MRRARRPQGFLVRGSLAALVLVVPLVVSAAPAAAGARPYRPDGWIKLCGLSLGCVIDPPPHPWRGKDVYNRTGRRQTVRVDINDGEGVRFWIAVQNDGTERDTVRVQGCSGTRVFEINRVLLGRHKRQDPSAKDLKRRYIRGTLTFTLDPGERVIFTLNIITGPVEGKSYRCRTELASEGDPERRDVVVASMATY